MWEKKVFCIFLAQISQIWQKSWTHRVKLQKGYYKHILGSISFDMNSHMTYVADDTQSIQTLPQCRFCPQGMGQCWNLLYFACHTECYLLLKVFLTFPQQMSANRVTFQKNNNLTLTLIYGIDFEKFDSLGNERYLETL